MDKGLIGILACFSFGLGACIASFLNVVIWRVPRGESIVSPPSHCPKCNAPIKWYQNIPILSWLALRGKCANCKAPISPRYILVEMLGGEKIDIVVWSEDPCAYVKAALSPADVLSVTPVPGQKMCRVVVPDDQLSLAIGKEGQNARLAARLTGYKIDIKPASQAEPEESEE